MLEILEFGEAMMRIQNASRKILLLGNGFSISLCPDIFNYESLREKAELERESPLIAQLFRRYDTNDFEQIIRYLGIAAEVLHIYTPNSERMEKRLLHDARYLKDALVKTIAQHHPGRHYDISSQSYMLCRRFLKRFDRIFSLNYDLLLYWAMMQDKVDKLKLGHDDGFRHPRSALEAWVSWQQGNAATVQYLHGALHIFDNGHEIIKYTWSKTDIPIVDQIRSALWDDKFPVFVAEGSSKSKLQRIIHNSYLSKCLRSFISYCKSPNSAVIIFGHSLHDNDDHILRCIVEGSIRDVLVSLYGSPESESNRAVIQAANGMAATRAALTGRDTLRVTFYDAGSAHVWS